jgi:hypothetical protein
MSKSLRSKLNIALKYLEEGNALTLSTGHTLAYDADCDDIGFLVTVTENDQTTGKLHMIGSETAWSHLRSHLIEATELEMLSMIAVPKN